MDSRCLRFSLILRFLLIHGVLNFKRKNANVFESMDLHWLADSIFRSEYRLENPNLANPIFFYGFAGRSIKKEGPTNRPPNAPPVFF